MKIRVWINLNYIGIFDNMNAALMAVKAWSESMHDWENDELLEIQMEAMR